MKRKKKVLIAILVIIIMGFLIPQNFVMPVEGADAKSYHHQSFWYYPWGKSVTHKGVDVFAKEGTNVRASTYGWVLYSGEISMGGNVLIVLGPKWRIHYYAHLQEIKTSKFGFIKSGELIATVGTTGNAVGKSPHLHYSIVTLIPYPWRIDADRQGWKKMFYLNPIDYMSKP